MFFGPFLEEGEISEKIILYCTLIETHALPYTSLLHRTFPENAGQSQHLRVHLFLFGLLHDYLTRAATDEPAKHMLRF